MSHRHAFKTGLNYINEPSLGGDFSSGTFGQFQMLEDRKDSPVGLIIKYGGFNGNETPIKQYNAYFQDDWTFNNRLTLNLGVRYDLWTGFNLDQTKNPLLPLYKQAAL